MNVLTGLAVIAILTAVFMLLYKLTMRSLVRTYGQEEDISDFQPNVTGSQVSSVSHTASFEIPAGELEKDSEVGFIMPEIKDGLICFGSKDFQIPIARGNSTAFLLYSKIQSFLPVQVTTHESEEWWWFQNSFYKVDFEKGHPSSGFLLIMSETGEYTSKLSLAGTSLEEGYAPSEIAEGVSEIEGGQESVHVRYRWKQAYTLALEYLDIVHLQNDMLNELRDSGDYNVKRDVSASLFLDKHRLWPTQVLIESEFHRPAEVLVDDDTHYWVASQVQKHHPILLDKKTGRGRYWKSEVVAEWWWFRDRVYLAKRQKNYQSDMLLELKENAISFRHFSKSGAWIPKCTVGQEIEGRYEDGYAPEEIVWAVFRIEEQEESLDSKIDRMRTAKKFSTLYSEFSTLWDEAVEVHDAGDDESIVAEREHRFSIAKESLPFLMALEKHKEQNRISLSTINTSQDSNERIREYIPRKVKMFVWQRDQGKCRECGSKEKIEYDHIIPVSKGGSSTERNLQLLCEHCNRSKGSSIV